MIFWNASWVTPYVFNTGANLSFKKASSTFIPSGALRVYLSGTNFAFAAVSASNFSRSAFCSGVSFLSASALASASAFAFAVASAANLAISSALLGSSPKSVPSPSGGFSTTGLSAAGTGLSDTGASLLVVHTIGVRGGRITMTVFLLLAHLVKRVSHKINLLSYFLFSFFIEFLSENITSTYALFAFLYKFQVLLHPFPS